MAITAAIDVQFGDCDPAAIVYYPTLFHYCHVAFERAWGEALGISYPDLIRHERLGFPTVHVDADFLSPVRYGDTVLIKVWVSKVGSSSAVFEFDGAVDGRPVLRASHTKVCTNLDTLSKFAIPAHLRARFEAFGR
jgi:4-hydroxybenzoyl-CoA thioesterase